MDMIDDHAPKPLELAPIDNAQVACMHALRNAVSVVGVSTVLAQRLLKEGDVQRGMHYLDQAVKSFEDCLAMLERFRSASP